MIELEVDGTFGRLPARQYDATLVAARERVEAHGRLRVFGYGSLLWRPCFEVSRRTQTTLHGFARRMCVWTVEARGTPQHPGLGLGLERGQESCQGHILEAPRDAHEQALTALWEREMLTGIYQPQWLRLNPGAAQEPVLAFVVDPGHPQYAGHLDIHMQAKLIAAASGTLGTNTQYLSATVRALQNTGLNDPHLEELLSLLPIPGHPRSS